MNLPLVSICVPIYNAEAYIERCVRSIMEQTYPNLEYIFVDDCSTDNSLSILHRVLKDYPEVQGDVTILSNASNRGIGYTRRIYTENAHGEYLVCVDSDDYIEKDMVSCLVNKAQETDADIVVAGYFYEKDKQIEIIAPYSYDTETDYTQLVLSDNLNSMWSKLIRRTLFTEGQNCYVPEGLDYGEDRLMCFFLSRKIKHIATIKKPLYHYIHHTNSISNTKGDKHFQCILQFWQIVDQYLESYKLTEKYYQITNCQKIADKIHLLHFCMDVNICRKYADIFREAEATNPPLKLSRGKRLTRFLTKHHLWSLLRIYKAFMRNKT